MGNVFAFFFGIKKSFQDRQEQRERDQALKDHQAIKEANEAIDERIAKIDDALQKEKDSGSPNRQMVGRLLSRKRQLQQSRVSAQAVEDDVQDVVIEGKLRSAQVAAERQRRTQLSKAHREMPADTLYQRSHELAQVQRERTVMRQAAAELSFGDPLAQPGDAEIDAFLEGRDYVPNQELGHDFSALPPAPQGDLDSYAREVVEAETQRMQKRPLLSDF